MTQKLSIVATRTIEKPPLKSSTYYASIDSGRRGGPGDDIGGTDQPPGLEPVARISPVERRELTNVEKNQEEQKVLESSTYYASIDSGRRGPGDDGGSDQPPGLEPVARISPVERRELTSVEKSEEEPRVLESADDAPPQSKEKKLSERFRQWQQDQLDSDFEWSQRGPRSTSESSPRPTETIGLDREELLSPDGTQEETPEDFELSQRGPRSTSESPQRPSGTIHVDLEQVLKPDGTEEDGLFSEVDGRRTSAPPASEVEPTTTTTMIRDRDQETLDIGDDILRRNLDEDDVSDMFSDAVETSSRAGDVDLSQMVERNRPAAERPRDDLPAVDQLERRISLSSARGTLRDVVALPRTGDGVADHEEPETVGKSSPETTDSAVDHPARRSSSTSSKGTVREVSPPRKEPRPTKGDQKAVDRKELATGKSPEATVEEVDRSSTSSSEGTVREVSPPRKEPTSGDENAPLDHEAAPSAETTTSDGAAS